MRDPAHDSRASRNLWPGAAMAALLIVAMATLFLFVGRGNDGTPPPDDSAALQQVAPVVEAPARDGGLGDDIVDSGAPPPGTTARDPAAAPPPSDALVPPIADEGPKQTFEPAARPRTLDAPREGERVVPDPVEANIAPQAVRAAVVEIRSELRGCFTTLLGTEPTAAGQVVLDFTIVNEEGVGRVEISSIDTDRSTLHEDGLHDCLSEAVGSIEVDVPPGFVATRVRYPIHFSPGETPP